jgi:tetratricopeptide (TPR) repeat protein
MSSPWLFSLALILCLAPVMPAKTPLAKPQEAEKPDYTNEAFVIEESSTRITYETDGKATRRDAARIKIQSEAGVQKYGVLSFTYEDATETLRIDYVRVRKPEGTVIETPPESAQDMASQITREAPFYSDLHEKHVAVKGLSIGDTIEFSVHHEMTKPLAPSQFWLQYGFDDDDIVLDERLEVGVPRDRDIKLKSLTVQPVVSENEAYRVYTWKTSHEKRQDDLAKKRELDKATWRQTRGRLQQPDILLSSFSSWDEVGRWYEGLQQERVKPSPELEAKAAELTKGATTERDKLQAIYSYVSTHFRYIGVAFGIGRYQPHTASEVFANQYGDCKDKHTLLAALLNAASIKAFPALINSVHEIDADVPSPGQFNHVITLVPQGGGYAWLDTTPEVAPFEYLPPNLLDKHALAIVQGKPAELLATPAALPFMTKQTFQMKGALDESGTLVANAEFETRGDLEFVLRSAFRRVPFANWKDLMQGLSYGFGFGGDVSEVTAGTPEKTLEPFHFAYKYTRKEFGDWSNHRIPAPMPGLGLLRLNDEDSTPEVPVILGAQGEFIFSSEIALPKGYTPQLPAAIHEKTPFAEYDATYSYTGGKLIGERRMKVLRREVPPSDFAAYRKFRKTVEDDYNGFVPLIGANSPPEPLLNPSVASILAMGSATAKLPDSSNSEALRLEKEAAEAGRKQDIQSAMSSLYRAVAADPKFTRAWIALGSLLMASKQDEGGREAFRKAIESDPKQVLPHKTYAIALMSTMKFEDAVPEWQEVMKLAPDDPDAPSMLAHSFNFLRRYADEASTLETAIKQNPQRTGLHLQLGTAYLREGKDGKAAEAFEKAAQSAPGAGTFNDIAYELAEQDVQLPLALKYAEKAVHLEETDTQALSLAKLSDADLKHTGLLAAYWDTLGWVHARMSHFGQAEKYLSAAWAISQEPVVGEHLCTVYERMHRIQAAIHTCQMALFRLPMSTTQLGDADNRSEALKKHLEHIRTGSSRMSDINLMADETSRIRTTKLARVVPGTASAEFFVLLAADGKTPGFTVRDAKFASGSAKLKSSGKALLAMNPKHPAPSGSPARMVRRGVLSCSPYSGCLFLMLDPSTVHVEDAMNVKRENKED